MVGCQFFGLSIVDGVFVSHLNIVYNLQVFFLFFCVSNF